MMQRGYYLGQLRTIACLPLSYLSHYRLVWWSCCDIYSSIGGCFTFEIHVITSLQFPIQLEGFMMQECNIFHSNPVKIFGGDCI